MHDQLVVQRQVEELIRPPAHDAVEEWLSLDPSLGFLERNALSDSVVLYLSAGHMYVHGVFVPTADVSPPDFDDLASWHSDPRSTWSFTYSSKRVWISTPLEGDSKTLQRGQQIVFLRSFEGVPSHANYVDILQPLVHAFGLHFMPERNAWCRLNKLGDLEDVFRVIALSEPGSSRRSSRMILGLRSVLDQYATLTKMTLVRLFDFTCIQQLDFGGWASAEEGRRLRGEHLGYRYGRAAQASYGRGAQIVPASVSAKEVLEQFWDGEKDHQYATFIVLDGKDGQIKEASCAPSELTNFYRRADKPFEITPAFFRPEVLLKYKADREKYDLGHRSIGCRGAWHLKSYDVNEAGQVHTYLGYLNKLPYEEQLHWKQYNEASKGGISQRAQKTDIEGSWATDYDPLLSLKAKLERLDASGAEWWLLRVNNAADRVHYPVTTSVDEWADELLNLDQLLIEGLNEKHLRKAAKRLGQEPADQLRSIGLLEQCLVGVGFETDHAAEIIAPFKELHHLRSKVKGHAGGDSAKELRRSVLQEHGSFANHYRALVERCDEALGIVEPVMAQLETADT